MATPVCDQAIGLEEVIAKVDSDRGLRCMRFLLTLGCRGFYRIEPRSIRCMLYPTWGWLSPSVNPCHLVFWQ